MHLRVELISYLVQCLNSVETIKLNNNLSELNEGGIKANESGIIYASNSTNSNSFKRWLESKLLKLCLIIMSLK